MYSFFLGEGDFDFTFLGELAYYIIFLNVAIFYFVFTGSGTLVNFILMAPSTDLSK